MIIRVAAGILLVWLLIAYKPFVLKCLPYLWPFILAAAAFFALRALPALAEPVGYGLIAALVCYAALILLHNRGKLKDLLKDTRRRQLPAVNIHGHPQISVLLTLALYTLGLTFALYVLILLIYVQ